MSDNTDYVDFTQKVKCLVKNTNLGKQELSKLCGLAIAYKEKQTSLL